MTRRRAWLLAGGLLATAALTPAGAVAWVWVARPVPLERLEQWPRSPVVTDRNGELMLRLIAADGQWRVPVPLERMSHWIIDATIAVEDERFRAHHGVDVIAVIRAAWQNVRSGRIVSGASTLSMQLCRMLDERERTLAAKIVEAARALQLEARLDKDGILESYLNLAPYGGNRRGVEAASLAYFGKPAAELALGEAALLAGLPQSPERLRPDRHPGAAAARRATVLRRMRELGLIDARRERTVAAEPIVLRPAAPPRAAHAAWMTLARRSLGATTTIDLDLQDTVTALATEHGRTLPSGADASVVVIDIASGDVLALVGSIDLADPVDGQVNGALARRSPGSALKPFVYAAAFEARRLAPDSIMHDVPISHAGWVPRNFDRVFRGVVTVSQALQRSLNVPAIHVASEIGIGRCAGVMEAAGVTLPERAVERAGLSLVVGGAEVTLLELTNAYATIGRGGTYRRPRLFSDDPVVERPALREDVCAALDGILSTRARPPRGWEMASPGHAAPWFMWKTGTSSGRRDAWAVGHNGSVAIGVWAGRFDGGGDPSFVGAEAAEPLLAGLFSLPVLRVDEPLRPPRPWLVRRPLPPPVSADSRLAILSPRDGVSFVAVGARAVVHPRIAGASGESKLHWFLDGMRLENAQRGRLQLGPGTYELRVVDERGRFASSVFAVSAAVPLTRLRP